jgi:ribose 5-phosphate isomerase B
MRLGLAVDHRGFLWKDPLSEALRREGNEIVDFGAMEFNPDDDFPDFVIPMARALARGELDRGIAVCGSGVGACIAANKIPGVRAALIHDAFSAHQGVEDDDMNVICLGGTVVGYELAWEIILIFLKAKYKDAPRFRRRLDKIAAVEREERKS